MAEHNDGAGSRLASAHLSRTLLFCGALIALFVACDVLLIAKGASFKREGGGLETVSAVLYGIAVIVFFRFVPACDRRRLLHVPALMVLFALRELDLDKAFTEAGVLSVKLYSGDAPLGTKVIAGAVALFTVYVILRNVWIGVPAVLQAWRAGQGWPWFAALAAGLVVATKSADGLGRKLMDFGIAISQDMDTAASVAEEVGEVFIPVCAILAMVACWGGAAYDRDAS